MAAPLKPEYLKALKAALEEIKFQQSFIEPSHIDPSKIVRDQHGVVWAGTWVMSREAYEALRETTPETPRYDDLPLWDSHNQNIVDVDD